MQEALFDQVFDGAAAGERRIEADARLGPQQPVRECGVDSLFDPGIPNGHEAGHVLAIVPNDLFP